MAEGKQTGERLKRLNLILRTIRSVDQVILEEKDRDRLIKGICDSLVKTRGYYNAWTALLDKSGQFTIFAEAGLGEDFLPLAEQLEREGATKCGQRALTQSTAVVINDPASSCSDCPLAEGYSGRGGITARLQYRGKLYGLLCASVPASLVTEAEERSLFEDVAGDIAFALYETEMEEERERVEHELRERVKDLACLYGIANILERAGITLDETYQEVANLLLQSWQYPEIACAKITIDGKEFKTTNYRETRWKQSAVIKVHNNDVGKIEVAYLQERPVIDEGPFQKEERLLINAVAERLGRRTEHKRTEASLRESENRYRALFDSANDGMLVHDLEGNIIMANIAMTELTGYTIDELMKMNISQFLSAPSFETAMEQQRRRLEDKSGAGPQRYELQMIRKDGLEKIIEVVTSLLASGEQPPIIQTIARDVTEQKRARENLRAYASRAILAQEEERKRVARELHDDTAQALASLGMDIDSLAKTRGQGSNGVSKRLEELRDRIDDILRGVRSLSQALRPPMLEEFNLLTVLQGLANDLADQRGIRVRFDVRGTPRRLSPDVELALFRIVQEALTNIGKHAQATESRLEVEYGPGKVKLRVSDNGQGFELPPMIDDFAYSGKLGLTGMRERAKLIDGNLTIRSEQGKGTTLILEVLH